MHSLQQTYTVKDIQWSIWYQRHLFLKENYVWKKLKRNNKLMTSKSNYTWEHNIWFLEGGYIDKKHFCYTVFDKSLIAGCNDPTKEEYQFYLRIFPVCVEKYLQVM